MPVQGTLTSTCGVRKSHGSTGDGFHEPLSFENVVYIFISFYSFGFVERDRGGEEAAQKAAVSTLRYRPPEDLLRERSLCPGTGANREEQGVSEVPGQTIFGVS